MIKRILIATIFIYYGYETYAQLMSDEEKDCLGWVCDVVQCPKGYAVWIPESGGFLPCEKFEEYMKTKDINLLR